MAKYTDTVRHAMAAFNHAVDVFGLADADILNLTTVEGSGATSLMGKIESKTALSDSYENLKRQLKKALSLAGPNGANVLTNTNLAAADTLAGVRAIFTAYDGSILATERKSFAF